MHFLLTYLEVLYPDLPYLKRRFSSMVAPLPGAEKLGLHYLRKDTL